MVQLALYWQFFVLGATSPLLLAHFGMSTRYYANSLAFIALFGAVGALLARGRFVRAHKAPIIIAGCFFASAWTALVVPSTPGRAWFTAAYCVLNLNAGFVLVALLALLRDLSPQARRGVSMSIGLVGVVGGSLAATFVGSLAPGDADWQVQYRIAGVFGLVVGLLALATVRTIPPSLSSQVIMSEEEIPDAEELARRVTTPEPPSSWQAYTARNVAAVFLGTFATGTRLLANVFLVLYLTSAHAISLADANALLVAFWLAYVFAVLATGLASDRSLVRKPFLLLGGMLTAVSLCLVLSQESHDGSAETFALLVALGMGSGAINAAFSAAYSEHVERWHPAGTEAGVALLGTLSRVVPAAVSFLFPVVLHQWGWTGLFAYFLVSVLMSAPLALVLRGPWLPATARRQRAEHGQELRQRARADQDSTAPRQERRPLAPADSSVTTGG